MMKTFYSIRMRGAEGGAHERGGRHISGAERIVEKESLERVAGELIHRALYHSKGESDFINITVETVETDRITYIPPLAVETHSTDTIDESHKIAHHILMNAGISATAVDNAFKMLQNLMDNMRGAIILDAVSGNRVDCEKERGIRVSHMDMDTVCFSLFDGMNEHFREAVVLASKVQNGPGILGELCWSDDPEYTIGYVACNHTYHRLKHMKASGSQIGGRVFFVKPQTDIDLLKQYLECEPVLVSQR